ncbi:MAG TPA: iron ABC transporter permease [Micromonosporaceae bacterium]|nr:iron ABC transporter permease [Micromonosporaceae bacterium]
MATLTQAPEQLPVAPRERRERRWMWAVVEWLRDHWLSIAIAGALLWVIGIPLLSAISYSFRTGSPADPGGFTLQNYKDAYANPLTGQTLVNTFIVAVAVSAIALTIATFFAWLVERTDVPGRSFAWVVMLLPLAMPGMLSAMGWILLLSKKIGVVNIAIRGVLGVFGVHMTTGPFDIYSRYGIILVEATRSSTALFLMMVAAFRLMDPALEEAAAMSGAGTGRTLRSVTLKLMAPAIIAAGMYSLVGNMEDLEVPLMIGVPAGVFLLPTLIWFTGNASNWGLSSAYTTIFLVITIAMVVIYYRAVLRRSGNFAVITGKAYRPRRMSLGRWRWPAFGLFLAFFILSIVLPIGVLVWASLLPVYEVPSSDALHHLTLSNYTALPHIAGIAHTVWNTISLAAETATATMILAFLVAWLVIRQRVRGGITLDALAFVPHAIPSVAVAVALIAFYLNPALRWSHVYGTVTIMVLALITRFMTFASRTANSAMAQLGKELEEVSYVSGVGRLRTLTRITFRLLSPAFIAGWIWVAANSIRNLTVPLMLSTSDNGTIATNLYFAWQRRADFSGASALGVALVAFLALLAIAGRRVIASGYSDAK